MNGEFENVKDNATITSISLQGHLLIISNRVDVGGRVASGFSDRKQVQAFSESSATRMRRYLRSASSEYTHFITLTYPCGYGYDGVVCKEHLRRFMQQLKRKSVGVAWSAFWFMEFQERGSIHFHVFTTEFFSKEWVASTWYRICCTEDERHLHAGTRIELFKSGRHGVCSYATKYAAKQTQKEIPEAFGWAGRFWGVSGIRTTKEATLRFLNRSELSKACNRKLDALNDQIVDDLKNKKCERMSITRDGVKVYVYKSMSYTLDVRRRILQAVISSTLYDGSGAMYSFCGVDELIEDICDE